MTVSTKEQAWEEASKIFPTGFGIDENASTRAGYDIYTHPSNSYNRIADLGNRLEVIIGEHGKNVTTIWIESRPRETRLKLKDFLKMVNEPVQIVIQKEGQCFEYACLSTGCHAEAAMEKIVYKVTSTVAFGSNAKMSVTVW